MLTEKFWVMQNCHPRKYSSDVFTFVFARILSLVTLKEIYNHICSKWWKKKDILILQTQKKNPTDGWKLQNLLLEDLK